MREVLRINALQDFPKNVRRIGKIIHRQMASTTLHILASIRFLVGTYPCSNSVFYGVITSFIAYFAKLFLLKKIMEVLGFMR